MSVTEPKTVGSVLLPFLPTNPTTRKSGGFVNFLSRKESSAFEVSSPSFFNVIATAYLSFGKSPAQRFS